MRTRFSPLSVAISLVLATLAGEASAANKSWACSTYFWNFANCWAPAGVPGSADTVTIAPVANTNTNAQVTIDANVNAAASTLSVDSTLVGNSANLNQIAGTLTTLVENIGFNGTGSFNQRGGSNTASSVMTLGYGVNSVGNYFMSAGTLTNKALIVGQAGQGNFFQSGGSHFTDSLALGTILGGVGNYFLDGGTLNVSGAITTGNGSGDLLLSGGQLTVGSGNISVRDFTLGESGTGSYTQTKGAVSASAYLVIGDYFDSTYQLNGGSLAVRTLAIGALGTGSFSQLAGSNTVYGDMALASFVAGTYTLAGGTLDVGGAITTGKGVGTLNLDSGVLTVASGNIGVTNLNVGSAGGSSGSYVQTNGAVTVGGNLSLGGGAGSTGVYTLSSGSLTVGGGITGGPGVSTLNLDGGTLAVGSGKVAVTNLTLGSQPGGGFTLHIGAAAGTDTFSSLSATNLTIGGLGSGSVFQTAGSVTVGTLTNNDTYAYNGGSLNVISALNNNGTLQLGGTTLTNAGTTQNNGVLSGYGRISGGGAFVNSGLVNQSGGPLTLAGAGAYVNNGNWDLSSGNQLRLEGTAFANTGSLRLNGGLLTGTGSLDNTSAGTISGRGSIGTTFSNAGTLALTDGTTTVSQAFINSGVIQLGSNIASLNGGAITNTGLIQGYGKVVNAVMNTGNIKASGGTLTLTQALSNSGNLVADNASTLLFQGGLSANSGNIRINGGALDNTGYTLTNSGQIQASTGAGQIYGDLTGLAGSKLIVSGGGSLTLYDKVDIGSGAELRVSAGSSATFFSLVSQRSGSIFSGTGTKFYEGGLSIGGSPGLGIDSGNVNFTAGNVFIVEIGGTTACTAACETDKVLRDSSFDKFNVGLNLELGGTLKLVSWNGFTLQAGQSYDLLDWGTVTGHFASIDTSDLLLAPGLALDTSHLSMDGSFNVVAVPEPGTWAMLLAGLAGLAGVRGRARPGKRS